jgi:hypothetical protein
MRVVDGLHEPKWLRFPAGQSQLIADSAAALTVCCGPIAVLLCSRCPALAQLPNHGQVGSQPNSVLIFGSPAP